MTKTLNPEHWVEKHGDYLFGFAISRVYSRQLAEDLVQETFISALASLKSFEGKSSEQTWLISILKNKITDHYRKASTRYESSYDIPNLFFQEEGNSKGHWIKDRRPNPWDTEKIQENEQLSSSLQDCISKLPPRSLSVFTKKYIDEEKTDKICKDTGISSSNYWVLIHRAKLLLRDCLEKSWFA